MIILRYFIILSYTLITSCQDTLFVPNDILIKFYQLAQLTTQNETTTTAAQLYSTTKKQWKYAFESSEYLILPTTSYTYPIKYLTMNNTWTPKEIINPQENTNVLPYEQMWVNCWNPHPYHLRLSDDVNVSNDIFWEHSNAGYPPEIKYFDGTNNHSIGIAATSCYIYLVKKSPNPNAAFGKELKRDQGRPPQLEKIKGILTTLSLDTEKNRYIYSTKNKKTEESFIYISDISEKFFSGYTATPIIHSLAPCTFKKIINLGNTAQGKIHKLGEVYLGLPTAGDCLYTFWQNNNTVEYKKQSLPSTWHITDIAVDNTVQCKSGFKPRVTILKKTDKRYDRYLIDFILFTIPTLFLTESIETEKDISHFSYHNETCSIISSSAGKFLQSNDHASMFLFAKVLKQNDNFIPRNVDIDRNEKEAASPPIIKHHRPWLLHYLAQTYAALQSFFITPFEWCSSLYAFFGWAY